MFLHACVSVAYLKMKMNSMSSIQKVATLSMVFIRTTSCLCRAGMNLTSFSTRMRRKVRSTESPPPCWPTISHTLDTHTHTDTQRHTHRHTQGSGIRTRVQGSEVRTRGQGLPDDNDDAIEDVVGVLDVAEEAIHQDLQ